MTKKSKSKTSIRKAKKARQVRVRKIKLAKAAIVRVMAPDDHLPVVLHPEPGIVEIVPVQKGRAPPKSWWDTLFGY